MLELVVDSFAGGGGASLGIEMALGRSPDIAINHDAEALAMHAANHPTTRHLSKNIWKVDPLDEVKGRKVGLAWFSPDCKHFSKAKGGKPVSRNIRDLAWVVVLWAKRVRPRVIILENVEEFRTWGPLDGNGLPCPVRKGQTFKRWVRELKKLGYAVEWRELRACDFGAPTIRKRLFLIARCDGRPIVWPKPSHAPAEVRHSMVTKWAKGHGLTLADLQGIEPYRTAADCIDWSIPCPSIFLSKEEGRAIGAKRPLADATMARIAKGVMRYVIEAAEPFIVPITHSGDLRAHAIGEPLRTVTTAHRGEHALIAPHIVRTAHGERDRKGRKRGRGQHPVQEPLPTVTASKEYSLVAPVLEPVSTIVQRGTTQALVSAHMINLKGKSRRASAADAPAPTVTSGGWHLGEVRAFLSKYYGPSVGQDLSAPLHTATSKARFGLVTVRGEAYQIVDIGMRMLTRRELFRAQGFPDSYIIDPVFNGKPLSNTASIRMCGNSVSPVMARALVAANYAAAPAEREAA